METPHYQIVLLDDDYTVTRCGFDKTTCLPLYDLDDLRFQVVSDFSESGGVNIVNDVIAIVCDACDDFSASEIYDIYIEGLLVCPEGCEDFDFTPFIRGDYISSVTGGHLWDMRYVIGSVSNMNEGECLRLCLWRVTYNDQTLVLQSAECLGSTNCFKKISDLCYTTKIKYQYNEASMGFFGTPTLSVRLPMYLSRPQFPGEEKGYQKSDGVFLKLSERINKEWTLTTDWIPQSLHERIRVALSADTITAWNENENLALEGIYKDADYDIQWHEEVDYPIAKATTKIKKRVLQTSVNSNCA